MNNNSRPIKAIVLAAGQGKRLYSEQHDAPKVMRLAAGKPLLSYVLSALDFIPPEDTIIVVGYKRDQVIAAFDGYRFAVQEEQLGTGHAVMAALKTIPDFDGDLLVCCGDMPLLTRETYIELVKQHGDNDCTILSGLSDEYLPYGRVIRGNDGEFLKVVEERDCSPEEKAVTELNSGVYVFRAPALRAVLSELRQDNAQGEYYLTDVPALEMDKGFAIGVCCLHLGNQLTGVNTLEQLEAVERILMQ